MNQKKENHQNLYCNVCQLNFTSEAEYAMHDFSKKHCDNLIKSAKNKPPSGKHKLNSKQQDNSVSEEKRLKLDETATSSTGTGVITKYGYFVPEEVPITSNNLSTYGYNSREYDYNYDPYKQKFAENPFKSLEYQISNNQSVPTIPEMPVSVTSFSKKKKKKIRSCQICSVTLTTIPEYEKHMKSPQHAWKLKMSGMGVSAHFVKASTDLHTTDLCDKDENSSSDEAPQELPEENNVEVPKTEVPVTTVPSLLSLFCDVCDMLLNSEQQFNAHVTGKSHNENVKRKALVKAKKEKIEEPTPDQLYCYSCKIPLNNLFQYNEHKNGKRHYLKCKQLIRQGITIPPEERPPSLPVPRFYPGKTLTYPEMYEKYILEPKRNLQLENSQISDAGEKQNMTQLEDTESKSTGILRCSRCNKDFESNLLCQKVEKAIEHVCDNCRQLNCKICGMEFVDITALSSHEKTVNHVRMRDALGTNQIDDNTNKHPHTSPRVVFHSNQTKIQPGDIPKYELKERDLDSIPVNIHDCEVQKSVKGALASCATNIPRNIDDKTSYKENKESLMKYRCPICDLDFKSQKFLEAHFECEEHGLKIVHLKVSGVSESDLIKLFTSLKPIYDADRYGRYSCSFCSVISNSTEELDQHLSSLVHNIAEKEYIRKKTIEIKEALPADENGKFNCKLCKVSVNSITEFNQHLHSLIHKYTRRAENAKNYLQQKLKLREKWKKKGFIPWRTKYERNPGVRTKIGGIATDLNTGQMASIPNLEPLEPKIDPVKNVDIGVSTKKPKIEQKDVKQIVESSEIVEHKARKRKNQFPTQQSQRSRNVPSNQNIWKHPNNFSYIRQPFYPKRIDYQLGSQSLGNFRHPNPPFYHPIMPRNYIQPRRPTPQFYRGNIHKPYW